MEHDAEQSVHAVIEKRGWSEKIARGTSVTVGVGLAVDGVRRLAKESTESHKITWQERVAGAGEIVAGGIAGFLGLRNL